MSPRSADANQRIRDDRREAILQVAAKVFSRKGLATTKISDIAAAAGVSYGLVYHYFGTKEAIFAALVDQAATSTLGLAEMLRGLPGAPLERLRRMTMMMLGGLQQQPEAFMITLEAITRENAPEESRNRLDESSEALRTVLKEILVAGQADGSIVAGSTEQLSTLYLSTIHGLAITLLAEGYRPDRFPTVDQFLHIFTA